jgi:hypothetical protein
MPAFVLEQETGSGSSTANTYALGTDVQAYLSQYGYQPGTVGLDQTITTNLNAMVTASSLTPLLTRAMVYLSQYRDVFIGFPLVPPSYDTISQSIVPGQALDWPRTALQFNTTPFGIPYSALLPTMYGRLLNSVPAGIPVGILNAQCQLVLEQLNNLDLFTGKNGGAGYLLSQKADVFEETYTPASSRSFMPKLPMVTQWIQPLLIPGAGRVSISR